MYLYPLGVAISWISAVLLYVYRQDILSAFTYAVIWPFGILLTPQLLYRKFQARATKYWLRTLDVIAFSLVVMNAPGAFYFHTFAPQWQYDRVLHLTEGAMTIAVFVLVALVAAGSAAWVRRILPVLFFAAVAAQGAWEVFQYTSDISLGSEMFLDGTQSIQRDVLEDILLGAIGVVLAVPYVRWVLRHPSRFLKAK